MTFKWQLTVSNELIWTFQFYFKNINTVIILLLPFHQLLNVSFSLKAIETAITDLQNNLTSPESVKSLIASYK